ncbi:MAG: DUF4091 domain-containing protein [Clostridia bacterium]|nr:DUF4091 domain-containing protein [Clostridia bacterium]
MKYKNLSVILALLIALSCTVGCNPTGEAKSEIWSTYNTVKVIQQSANNKAYEKLSAEINVDMMMGEYEGGQIIITPAENADFTFEVKDLTSEGGDTLPKDKISVYLQRYIEIKTNFNGSPQYTAGDFIPDMLMPYDIAVKNKLNKLSKSKNQGITVEFDSTGVKPGRYSGTFVLKIGGEKTDIPVHVNVWDIEYTGRRTYQSSFLIYNDQLPAGEYDNSKEVTDRYIDFLLKYKINAYVVRDNYSEEHLKECVKNFDNNNFNSIVIPVDFPLGYVPDPTDERYNKSVEYITWLGEQSTEEKMYVKYAYFYPSSYDEADVVDERKQPSESFFAPGGNYEKTLNGAIENLKKSAAFKAKPTALQNEIINYIKNIPAVFTNVNYIDEWVSTMDAVFCPYVSLLNDNATAKKYDHAAKLRANDQLWIYSCSSPNYPYSTFHIDDTTLKMRVNGWMNMAYGIDGYLYYEVNKYTNMHDENPNEYVNVYEDASRYSKTNGDGYLLYPGKYYGSEMPFASLRLISYRDGMDDYDMLCVYERLLRQKAAEYGIKNIDFKAQVEDLYNQLFSGVVAFEDDAKLYEVRRELAQRILDLKNNDGMIVLPDRTSGVLKLNIYAASPSLTVDGKTLGGTAAGKGYAYSYIADNKTSVLKIKIGENTHNYAVNKYQVVKAASARLSEGSTSAAVTDGTQFTIKPVNAEEDMIALVRPFLKYTVTEPISHIRFNYKNSGSNDIDLSIRLVSAAGKIDVLTDYCAVGETSEISASLNAADVDWSTVTALEISFDNVVLQGDTTVPAPDKTLTISNLWFDLAE